MDEQNYIVCVYDVNGATYFINHLIIMNAGQLGSKLFEFERRLQNKKHTFEQRKANWFEKNRYSMRSRAGLTSRMLIKI